MVCRVVRAGARDELVSGLGAVAASRHVAHAAQAYPWGRKERGLNYVNLPVTDGLDDIDETNSDCVNANVSGVWEL